jgi:hypothetical protein
MRHQVSLFAGMSAGCLPFAACLLSLAAASWRCLHLKGCHPRALLLMCAVSPPLLQAACCAHQPGQRQATDAAGARLP